jgi:hypothetical protein
MPSLILNTKTVYALLEHLLINLMMNKGKITIRNVKR